MTVIQLITKDEIYQYPHTCIFISITYKSHLEYQAFTPEILWVSIMKEYLLKLSSVEIDMTIYI